MAKKRMSSLAQIGLAALAATAVAGVGYAINGTDLPKLAKGSIKLGVGLLAGAPLTMVSPGLGLGTIGAGVGLGATDLGSEAIAMLASAPADNGAATSAIRSRKRRRQMGAVTTGQSQSQRQLTAATAASALSGLRAVGQKVRAA